MEMGADIVKLNMPKIDPDKDKDSPAPYNEGGFSQEEAIAPGWMAIDESSQSSSLTT